MTSDSSPALPTAGLWNIDEVHSTAIFAIRHHAVGTFRMGFASPSGAYDAGSGELAGEVQVANIQAPVAPLYGHLQSPDFFDAEHHPTLSFSSAAVTVDAAGALQVDGDLTIRGITKPVHGEGALRPVRLVGHPDGSEAEHFGIDIRATIDRRDYAVSFNNRLPGGIENLGWEVILEIALELIDGEPFRVSDFG